MPQPPEQPTVNPQEAKERLVRLLKTLRVQYGDARHDWREIRSVGTNIAALCFAQLDAVPAWTNQYHYIWLQKIDKDTVLVFDRQGVVWLKSPAKLAELAVWYWQD